MPGKIIKSFEPKHAKLWSRQTVKLQHNLPSSPLFSEESLANLIDELPSDRVAINTMAPGMPKKDSWSYCDHSGRSGEEILDIVKNGRLWVNMTQLETVSDDFAELLENMFLEFEQYLPDFQTFKRSIGLLVSSPNSQVFYHCDVPGQSLWQIAGRKRVFIYPAEEPFLNPPEVENVIRARTEEEVNYESWYDEYAEIYDLEPGEMLHWRLNGPHRVVNLDSVNISITTEHWTPEIRRSYAMNYGNGILRDLGLNPKSRSIEGLGFWSKVALTAAWRASGLHKGQAFKRTYKFKIDPSSAGGLVPLASE